MPLLSIFTPCGLLEFSSEPSKGEKVYRAMLAAYRDPTTGLPTIDTTPGTHQEAKLYAWSMAIADAMMHTEQAGRELRPERSYYLLESHEEKFGIKPPAEATVAERRAEVALRQKSARGPRWEAMLDLLRTLLGNDFIAYRPISVEEATAYPTDGGSIGTYPRLDVPSKTIRLTRAAARPGVQLEVTYESWNTKGAEVIVVKGDRLIIDPGNWGLAEHVDVIDATGTGATRRFTALFTKPHPAGAFASTGPFPLWMNSKRHVMVVVSAAASVDPTIHERVSEHLRRVMRAPTTWSIVQPNVGEPETMGPFYLGISPLGAVPLESLLTNAVLLAPL